MSQTLLGGVSQGSFDFYCNFLSIRGWFLSCKNYDAVAIYTEDGLLIGHATLGVKRDDVARAHPDFNEPCAGWKYEGSVANWPDSGTLVVRVLKDNNVVKEVLYTPECLKNTPDAVCEIKKSCRVVEEKTPPIDPSKIRSAMVGIGFEVVNYSVDVAAYETWKNEIDYATDYPAYTSCFGKDLYKKMVQHYLSIRFVDLAPSDVVMDVASSISVFPDIVKCHYKVKKIWRHDMKYRSGIHGDKIGSFASKIPLPDKSVDVITLHCSLEHFEGDEDRRFFREGMRLLKPGGRMCIIPLYMANHMSILTSPSIWLSKYKSYNQPPVFDKRATIYINNDIKQRQSKFYSVETLYDDLSEIKEHSASNRIYHIENFRNITGCPSFALVIASL